MNTFSDLQQKWIKDNRYALWEHDGASPAVKVRCLSGSYPEGVFGRDALPLWDGASSSFRWMNRLGSILEYEILDLDAMKRSYVRFYTEKKESGRMDMETIDKLYLELSHISQAKTAKEIELEKKLADVEEKLRRKTEGFDRLKQSSKLSQWLLDY